MPMEKFVNIATFFQPQLLRTHIYIFEYYIDRARMMEISCRLLQFLIMWSDTVFCVELPLGSGRAIYRECLMCSHDCLPENIDT